MPYVTQDKRVGLREPIDEEVARRRKVAEPGSDEWQSESFTDLVEHDLHYMLTLSTAQTSKPSVLARVTKELRNRLEDGQQIGGDMNFCTCRYLVGLTEIYLTPKYEDKIQWIQERLEAVRYSVCGDTVDGVDKRALGILRCVSQELSRRYAGPYEDMKCFGHPGPEDSWIPGNGDIMD